MADNSNKNEQAETASRLSDWIPLNLKGKPMYHGVNETERMNTLRKKINSVRGTWNSPEKCSQIVEVITKAIEAESFDRELQYALKGILDNRRYWADHSRSQADNHASVAPPADREDYAALELYTTNDGYKKVFGYINQMFRRHDISELQAFGAVALVELLTIDLYNFRLAHVGCSKYYNFQDIVHRGLSVDSTVLQAFQDIMKAPLQDRNFSVPLAFVSTSISQARIQEFLDKTEVGKVRMHWKIHVHALDPTLLAQYQAKHPDSVVTTICAMPISQASEFPNEQEVLLRGAFFQILRIYEEQAGDHTVHVAEMVMLNANRDHGSELAEDGGEKEAQRKHFGQICAATRFEICASLAREYGLAEADGYKVLADAKLESLRADQIDAPYNAQLFHSWSVPRLSWIGASLASSFPTFYSRRREKFSRASFSGIDWDTVREIISDEYEWQKSDWCNVPRLYDSPEAAADGSGFTVLHQAAFAHAKPDFVQSLINLGAWRTIKSLRREGFVTAYEIAKAKGYEDLASILEPSIHHSIPEDTLVRLEQQVHDLLRRLEGNKIAQHAVRLPQLSVMTEMSTSAPSLWVPIPTMYGGFILDLDSVRASVTVTRISNVFPRSETVHIVVADGVQDLHSS